MKETPKPHPLIVKAVDLHEVFSLQLNEPQGREGQRRRDADGVTDAHPTVLKTRDARTPDDQSRAGDVRKDSIVCRKLERAAEKRADQEKVIGLPSSSTSERPTVASSSAMSLRLAAASEPDG